MWRLVLYLSGVLLITAAPNISPIEKVLLKSTVSIAQHPLLRSFHAPIKPMSGSTEGIASNILEHPHPSSLDKQIIGVSDEFNPFSGLLFPGEELAEEFNLLPDCQRECTSTLHDTLLNAFKKDSYVEKYYKICQAYKEAKRCVAAERERCDENSDMFYMLTSGIEYMCVEQGKAFNATIKCVDREAHAVKALCKEECVFPHHLMNILTLPSFVKNFGPMVNMLRAGAESHVPAFGEGPMPLHPGPFHLGPDPKTGNGLGLINDLHSPQSGSDSLRDFQAVTHEACEYEFRKTTFELLLTYDQN